MFVKIRVDFGGQQKMHNMVLVGGVCFKSLLCFFLKLESWGHDPI